MCDMCLPDGEMSGCQSCGTRLICFDEQGCDDIVSRAVVTSSGDVACVVCASQCEQEEEEALEEDWGWLPPYGDDRL